MAETRHASVTWNGDLISGAGTIDYVSSGVFSRMPVSWAARTSAHNGKTSPEELLAAAHASCFSMAFSAQLTKAGHEPTSVKTTAKVNLEKGEAGFGITRIDLVCRAKVPGIDAATFQEKAEAAKAGCPVSRALQAVEITLDARLES